MAAIPPLSCFQNLGFLLETHKPRKRSLKKHWEPNWTAKVKGEGRAKVHRVVCLCKFGFLHLHSYEQSVIRKLLLNSRQVLAPFKAYDSSYGIKVNDPENCPHIHKGESMNSLSFK